ncbi:Obg family GTPase CgtA [Patescibacteria group bacterium]
MFVDELKIYAKAGKGGDGVVRFKHEKYKEFMGPSGGDGGSGADVYIKAVRDLNALQRYIHKRKFQAENGQDGMGDSMEGKNGEDLYIELPVGSIVTNLETDKKFNLLKEGDEFLILKGGRGGFGNEHFKGSKNTTPQESTEGKDSEDGEFFIELELIADVGLIGFPNAGKSSLLNEITRAQAKIGGYPFTTLEPNLGELYGYIIADIPGLIEGASEGKGLGHKFLRHIKRTKVLLHLISLENEDIIGAYNAIRDELKQYDQEIIEKPEIIVLTKTDLLKKEDVVRNVEEIKKILEKEVKVISIYDDISLKELSDYLINFLK